MANTLEWKSMLQEFGYAKRVDHSTKNLKIGGSNPATDTCGLYYKNILMIVNDNHKLRLYYKCYISPSLSLS